MPAIFVHGVPDTERVWQGVLSRLARPGLEALSLPGFGCPAPEGFAATKDAYVTWLVDQIAARTGPVDLVGHDWGAILVLRVACLRPDLVRSWAAGAGPLDADYVWHKTAQLWQTLEVGEQVMTKLTAAVLEKGLTADGVPPADARQTGARVDDTMKRCILRLYRSAVTVGAEWSADLGRLTAPGLVLWGDRDPYAAPTWGERLAGRTGARFVPLAGCHHWWPLERPAEVAAALTTHWDGLGR
jgi:pimeloyl-ACP methyl ester carboxylesterase